MGVVDHRKGVTGVIGVKAKKRRDGVCVRVKQREQAIRLNPDLPDLRVSVRKQVFYNSRPFLSDFGESDLACHRELFW